MQTQDFSYYRNRVYFGLSVAAGVILIPFSANNFVQGRGLLGAGTALLVAMFLINAAGIHLRNRAPIPAAVLIVPLVAAVAWSARTQGIPGVLWAYPALLLISFIFRESIANAMSVLLIAAVGIAAYVPLGLANTARAIVTLSLVTVFVNIFSLIVGKLRRQLEEQATVDPLTGALNRRQLAQSLDGVASRCRRYNAAASLLALDVDHFKRINDDLGHGTGDHVLREAVRLIRARVRLLDLVFRMGGEEFLILLPDAGREGALLVAEDLRAAIANATLVEGRQVTVSVGVAPFKAEYDRDAWLKRADAALYASKEAGRNRVTLAES